MSFALGIVVLILGILVSIGLHEIGHMVPAKRFGVKVPEYSIGFGPTLWSVTRGETTYFVKAIPLGGYVRLAGMLPPAKAEPARDANGNLTWAEEARQDARRDLGPGEDHLAFSALPAWMQSLVRELPGCDPQIAAAKTLQPRSDTKPSLPRRRSAKRPEVAS